MDPSHTNMIYTKFDKYFAYSTDPEKTRTAITGTGIPGRPVAPLPGSTDTPTTLAIALASHGSGKTPVFLHPDDPRLSQWETIFGEEAKKHIIPVNIAWQLNERMYGELQGLNKLETKEQFGEEQVQIWRRSYDVAPPEGESLKTCAERTIPYFTNKVIPCLEKGENVLIVAHGNSLRSIVMHIEKLTRDQVLKLEMTLGKPVYYTYETGVFRQ